MEISRLEEFILIAQEGGIRRAAVKMGLSPTTLTSRLSVLEKEAGTPLFVRQHSALELTEKGKRFYKSACEITESYHQLTEQMKQINSASFHSLRIGIIGSELPFHLGPYLDILNMRYPHIVLNLIDETRFTPIEGLLSGEVDIVLGPVMSRFHHDDIICHTIAQPHSSVILPADHPLAQKESLTLRQLKDETFLLYPDTHCSWIRDFQIENLTAVLHHFEAYDNETAPLFLNYLIPVGKGLLFVPFHSPGDIPKCVHLPVTNIPYPAPDSILFLKNPFKKEIKDFVSDFLKFAKENGKHEHRKTL